MLDIAGEILNGENRMIYGNYASKYHELGMQPIPLDGKKPILSKWQVGCKRAFTEMEIERMIKKYPNKNIGICLGPSSGLVAIDIDIPREHPEFGNILKILPKTPVSKVGAKGITLFYKCEETIKPWKKDPFAEFLSIGNQTVMPPSIHPDTKKTYHWVDEDIMESFDEIPILTSNRIEQAKIFCDGLKQKYKGSTKQGRNSKLFHMSLAAADKGKSRDLVCDELMQFDLLAHEKPYFSDVAENKGEDPRSFALRMVDRAMETVGRSPVDNVDEIVDEIDENYPSKKNGFYNLVGEEKAKWVPDYEGLAEYLDKEVNLKFFNKSPYLYNGKHYEYVVDPKAKKEILNLIRVRRPNPNTIDMFFKFSMVENQQERSELVSPDGHINMNNGVFRLSDCSMLPHDPSFMFDYCLPHDYDPNATCPEFDKFLDFIFSGDQQRIDLALEIIAYCVMGGPPFLEKAFVFVGEGANGKTTLINVIRDLLGIPNCSSLSMARLSDLNSLSLIDNKLANLVEESPKKTIDSETFKNLVSGGLIQAKMLYKDQYYFKNKARLIFATNHMPHFQDSSHGNIRKLCFLSFDRIIMEHEMDRTLYKKLEAEYSGIFNKAISKIEELKKSKSLTIPNTSHNLMNEYRLDSDSVYRFLNETVQIDAKYKVVLKAQKIYAFYKEWCEESGIRSYLGNRAFYQRVRKLTHGNASIFPGVHELKRDNQLAYSGLMPCTDRHLNWFTF